MTVLKQSKDLADNLDRLVESYFEIWWPDYSCKRALAKSITRITGALVKRIELLEVALQKQEGK